MLRRGGGTLDAEEETMDEERYDQPPQVWHCQTWDNLKEPKEFYDGVEG